MELKLLKIKLQNDPTNQHLKELIANSQHQLNILLSKDIAYKMKLAKQNFFKHANRTGKQLAYKLHKVKVNKRITQIKIQDGFPSSSNTKIRDY